MHGCYHAVQLIGLTIEQFLDADRIQIISQQTVRSLPDFMELAAFST